MTVPDRLASGSLHRRGAIGEHLIWPQGVNGCVHALQACIHAYVSRDATSALPGSNIAIDSHRY